MLDIPFFCSILDVMMPAPPDPIIATFRFFRLFVVEEIMFVFFCLDDSVINIVLVIPHKGNIL